MSSPSHIFNVKNGLVDSRCQGALATVLGECIEGGSMEAVRREMVDIYNPHNLYIMEQRILHNAVQRSLWIPCGETPAIRYLHKTRLQAVRRSQKKGDRLTRYDAIGPLLRLFDQQHFLGSHKRARGDLVHINAARKS
jgi:hypothetical protein